MMRTHPYLDGHELRDGKLWVNGEHRFLKTGKPLRNYGDADEVESIIEELPIIASKGYDNLALNCYWHHLNPTGDGQIEKSVEPLSRLIQAIHDHGMYTSLSVETYGVGGGQIPAGFWEAHPESIAINHEGKVVRDTEYGYNSAVPSLFSKAYLEASRRYMTNIVSALGAENFLYVETTVEPQYMGAQWLDFSDEAKAAYEKWLAENSRPEALPFPEEFPAIPEFLHSTAWNCFRANALAEWVNEDARALRAGAYDGGHLWIASDYLDAEEKTMPQRCGDPVELLRNMSETDIVQINWSWCNVNRRPNKKAYERVRQVMKETGRDWVITEHMTINGSDYYENEMVELLENTLQNSTRFGWEFVDIAADRDDPSTKPNQVIPGDFKPQHFSVYDANWNPKPPMQVVESTWDEWMEKVKAPSVITS
ncbi:MAG: hypothetical protein AB3N63_10755 [Puniceicoccaceae bacterium]